MRYRSPVDRAVSLLLMLLAQPKARAKDLAAALETEESWIVETIESFRRAGLNVNYNRARGEYEISVGGRAAKAFRKLVATIDDVVGKRAETTAPRGDAATIGRYTPKEFGQILGMTPFNVYNMISGYKGARLPAGWCAYQLTDHGHWKISKMAQDSKGNPVPPKTAINAASIVIGAGEIPTSMKKALKKGNCIVKDCPDNEFSRRFCYGHYFQARRHPENFPNPNDGLPWPPKGIAAHLKKSKAD